MERRHPRQPPARPLVLLADGHADTCELYATSLGSLGFETAIISSGADAFTQAWHMHPDIIVTEVRLPQLDGWDFIRDVKRDPRTRDIPVVIVTCDGQAHTRERADKEGCTAFLLKPCLPEDLAMTLRAVLNETHAHDYAPSAH